MKRESSPPKRKAPAKSAAKRRNDAPLTQRVYDRLKAEILTCELTPGLEVSEAELALRFKTSKTPVREALAMLRAEGFVNTFPRRGYQIVPITFDDMQDLFDIRIIIEAGAAELACQRISDAEIKDLYKLADVIYEQTEKVSLKSFIRANRDFHGAIAKATGSQRLYDLVTRQIDALERFFYLGATLRDVSKETQNDHFNIVRILEKRDPKAARQALIEHNEQTRKGLFEVLSRNAAATRIRI